VCRARCALKSRRSLSARSFPVAVTVLQCENTSRAVSFSSRWLSRVRSGKPAIEIDVGKNILARFLKGSEESCAGTDSARKDTRESIRQPGVAPPVFAQRGRVSAQQGRCPLNSQGFLSAGARKSPRSQLPAIAQRLARKERHRFVADVTDPPPPFAPCESGVGEAGSLGLWISLSRIAGTRSNVDVDFWLSAFDQIADYLSGIYRPLCPNLGLARPQLRLVRAPALSRFHAP